MNLRYLWFFNFDFSLFNIYINIAQVLCSLFYSICYGILLKYKKICFFLLYSNLYLFTIFIKINLVFRLVSLMDLIVIDYPLNTNNRFILIYSFLNVLKSFRFFLQLSVNFLEYVSSISKLIASSAWLEREAWDFFGIIFIFNNDLRRILNDYGFKGFPLRKDFPLMGFIECFYDDSYSFITMEPVEVMQKMRLFKFENPWGLYI